MSDPVVVTILRTVKTGRETEFENEIQTFFDESESDPHTNGQFLIRPIGSAKNQFGILRSFDNESEMRAFYRSDNFARWNERVQPLVDGEPVRQRLHGLEAFFPTESDSHPPKWKMSIVTWMGVYPAVLLWSWLLGEMLSPLGMLFSTAIVTAIVVVTLSWAFMPVLVGLFHSWLHKTKNTEQVRNIP